MGARGMAGGVKRRNELQAKLKEATDFYKQYAKALNYTNKSDTRDRFDYWRKRQREIQEELSKLPKPKPKGSGPFF